MKCSCYLMTFCSTTSYLLVLKELCCCLIIGHCLDEEYKAEIQSRQDGGYVGKENIKVIEVKLVLNRVVIL